MLGAWRKAVASGTLTAVERHGLPSKPVLPAASLHCDGCGLHTGDMCQINNATTTLATTMANLSRFVWSCPEAEALAKDLGSMVSACMVKGCEFLGCMRVIGSLWGGVGARAP